MTLYEVDEAANRIRDEVDPDANIIFGSTFDASLEGHMRVSVVATGIDAAKGDTASRSAQIRQFLGQDNEQVMQKQVVGLEMESSMDNQFQGGNSFGNSYQGDLNQNSFASDEADAQSEPTSVREKLHLVEDNQDVEESFTSEPGAVMTPVIEKKKSFFGKLSSFISGNKKHEVPQNNYQVAESSNFQQKSQAPQKNDAADEDLDIPAFLRRK